MIKLTKFNVDKKIIEEAFKLIPKIDFRISLNTPSNRFFYDPWIIKDEYKDTIWEEILKSLKVKSIGEARIIKLEPETCYSKHADIDDRWHLSLHDGDGYLLDLDSSKIYKTETGFWYKMNAGKLHSAINIGEKDRYQLVVRQLLKENNLINPCNIRLEILDEKNSNYRFLLDNYISPWLNQMSKNKKISKFHINSDIDILFSINKCDLSHLENLIEQSKLKIKITYE